MKQALHTLQFEQDAGRRAEAERTVLGASIEALCTHIFNTGESTSARLIACSALGTKAPLSRDVLLYLLDHMHALAADASSKVLLSKLAQIIAFDFARSLETFSQDVVRLITELSVHFTVHAPILEEFFLHSLALDCKANVKSIAMLATSVFAAAPNLPIGQMNAQQGLHLVTLLRAASAALPNDPALFCFLFTKDSFAPHFFELFRHPDITCEISDLIATLLTVKMPKNSPTATSVLGPPLLYLVTHGSEFYSSFSYNQLKAVAMCLTTIYITHSNILRPSKDFIASVLSNFLCIFAQHPSHLIFDILLPSLINIFNDLSLRAYDIPVSLTLYLIERVCFYVNRHNLRNLLSVADDGMLTESEDYLSQDSIGSNTSFWLTWFAAFKGSCMSLVGKLAVFYPSITLKMLAQNLSQFFVGLANFENSMSLEEAKHFTRHTEQYNTMDSVIAVVDAAVYSINRHLLYNYTYAEFLQGEEVQQIAKIILAYKPVHPILYYRLMSILENFYKDLLSGIYDSDGNVIHKQTKGHKRSTLSESGGSASSPANANSSVSEVTTSAYIKSITNKYIGPLLQPIFQLYLQMIVFKSSILQESHVSGEELYSKLSQDTLALRRLAADRAKNLATNSYLIRQYIIPTPEAFESLSGHVMKLQRESQITAYEYVLLSQIIANAMLAHNNTVGFQSIVMGALEQSRGTLFSKEVTSALASPEAYIAHFGLTSICTSNPASLTTPTPLPTLLERRKLMFSIQQAKEALMRMHSVAGSIAGQEDLIVRLKEVTALLLMISNRGFLAATPKYFEQQLSNQRLLLGGTISGGVAKVDLENYDSTATDIEHAHSWLERCLISSLQCIALNQVDHLSYLASLDYSVIPAYILRLILSAVPRVCNTQVILILSRIVNAQYYDVHSIYTLLADGEHRLLDSLLPQARSSCVLLRTAQTMIWEDLQEKKEVLARNLLNLCNKAAMDICLKLFLAESGINKCIQTLLLTNQQFLDYSLSLLFSLFVSFSGDAKCAAHIATLICKVTDFMYASAKGQGNGAPHLENMCLAGGNCTSVQISQDFLQRITVFAFAFIIQYSQYESYLSCFCTLAGRAVQLADASPPIGIFYPGNEHLAAELLAALKNTPLNNPKQARQAILSSLKQGKRIHVSTPTPSNITVAALMAQRADVDDGADVNIGECALGDILNDE